MIFDKNKETIVDGNLKIGLDTESDITFVSHAHADHKILSGNIICTPETAELMRNRYNFDPKNIVKTPGNVKFLDAGHILGSAALLYQGEKTLLYTGDFCDRKRLFMNRFLPRNADILVMESTFGREDYVLPEPKEVMESSLDWINAQLGKGNNVVAHAYSLGKAQILEKLFESLEYPVFVHGSMLKINSVYSKFGIDLNGFITYKEAKDQDFDKKPFVVLTPPRSSMNIKAKRVFFSGWAKDVIGYDATFPLSDHADFFGLLETAEKTNPEKIYVTHGFNEEFARELKARGFDAEPI
jgi:Cft2 family RNA processing exonuclease